MNYDKWREEYERTKPPNAAPFDTIDALNSLRVTLISFDTFVNNRILLDALNNLKWGMVDVTGSKYRFVTSDRPVVRTNGLDKPGSHVIVPLSPTRLFIAADNDATARIFQQMPPRDLVMRINRKVVRNAIRFVWAGDMTNERLIMEQHAADAATDPTYF
jgi:hypothetical protein